MEIKLINRIDEFYSFKNIWKNIEQETNHTNITSSYDWQFTWWSVFKDINNNIIGFDKQLLIICLYENSKLIAIAPFIKLYRRKLGLKVNFIEFLGQQWGGNYLDIIGYKLTEKQINNIFEWLKNNIKYDILFLKYITEDSQTFTKDKLNLYSVCPQIKISNYKTFDDYIKKNYSNSLKQNIRTAYNKANKCNDIITTSVETYTDENFQEIIQLSKSKLIDNKKFLYEDNNIRMFMQQIFKTLNSNFVFVNINNKKVAYRANVFFNNAKFCIDASYDRTFRKYELGSISVDANIKDSFNNKIDSHCLGPGLDFYKQKFTKNNIKIYVYSKKGNTIISTLIYKFFRRMIFNKEKEALKSLQ